MHDDGLLSGDDAHSFKSLILSGIPDTQTKMSVSKKDSHTIKIGNEITAASIHTCSAMLLLFTHHNGMLAHSKQGLE